MTQAPFKIRDKMSLKNAGSDTYSTLFQNASLTANRTITIPDKTDTLAVIGTDNSFSSAQSFGAGVNITGGGASNFLLVQTGGTAATTKITVSGTTWQIGGTSSTITEAGVFTGANFVLVGTKNTTLASGATGSNWTMTLPTTAGTNGYALTTNGSGTCSWTSVVTNPMANAGDMIYGGVSGAPTNLVTGATAGILAGGNGTTPAWTATPSGLTSIGAKTLIMPTGGSAGLGKISYTTTTGININNSFTVADDGTVQFGVTANDNIHQYNGGSFGYGKGNTCFAKSSTGSGVICFGAYGTHGAADGNTFYRGRTDGICGMQFYNYAAGSAGIDFFTIPNGTVDTAYTITTNDILGGCNLASLWTFGFPAYTGTHVFHGYLQIDKLTSGTVTSNASGVLSISSDGRLKTESLTTKIPGLAEVLKLIPRAYQLNSDIEVFKEKAPIELGFFANETAEVIPESAPMGNNGYYGFHDRAIIAALVKAAQEQNEIITSLEMRIKSLETSSCVTS